MGLTQREPWFIMSCTPMRSMLFTLGNAVIFTGWKRLKNRSLRCRRFRAPIPLPSPFRLQAVKSSRMYTNGFCVQRRRSGFASAGLTKKRRRN